MDVKNLTPEEYAKEKNRRRAKEWRKNNPERDKENHRRYYLKNREKRLAYQRAYDAAKKQKRG